MRDLILEVSLASNVIVGALVLLSQPRRAVNQAFALLSVLLCTWLSSLLIAFRSETPEMAELGIRLASVAGFACFAAFIVLQTLIIKGVWVSALRKSFPVLIATVVVCGLCWSKWFLSRAVLIPNSIPEPFYGPGFVLYSVLICGVLGLFILNFFIHRNALSGIARTELEFMLLGAGCGLAWTIFCGVLAPALAHTSSLVSYDPLATTFLQVTLAYGIATKKILDPAYFLRRLASYALFGGALVLLYYFLQKGLYWINSSTTAATQIAFLVGAASVYPLFHFSLWLGTKLLLPVRSSNAGRLINQLTTIRQDSTNPEEIIRGVRELLRAEFQIEEVGFVSRIEERNPATFDNYTSLCQLTNLKPAGCRIVVLEEVAAHTPRQAALFPPESKAILSLHLAGKREPLGFLILGPRLTGQSYNTTVQTILVRMAEPVALYLDHFEALAEAKAYAEQVRRSDRLSSLGTIAANLVHEIKNPLSVIFSLAQALRDRYDDPAVRNEFTSVAMNEVGKLEKLLRQLMRLGKPTQAQDQKLDLASIITDLQPLLSVQLTGTEISVDAQKGESELIGNKESLEQAIFNVAQNAIEATKGRPSRKVTIRLCSEKGHQVIYIDDNGSGISDADIPLIFDPFFSRKEHGTGLGLSIVDQIVREHRGTIHVGRSKLGGTCFAISFPKQNL